MINEERLNLLTIVFFGCHFNASLFYMNNLHAMAPVAHLHLQCNRVPEPEHLLRNKTVFCIMGE